MRKGKERKGMEGLAGEEGIVKGREGTGREGMGDGTGKEGKEDTSALLKLIPILHLRFSHLNNNFKH